MSATDIIATDMVTVTVDHETNFAARLVLAERWNGFAQPYFTFEEAMRLTRWINDLDDETVIAYDKERDVFVEHYDGEDIDFPATSGIDGERIHGIGAGAWMWDVVTARQPTDDDIEAAVALSKRQILGDIGTRVNTSGETMPATIRSFAELHDYVDANEYGGLCDESSGIDWLNSDASETVQNRVNDWLAAGRPEND